MESELEKNMWLKCRLLVEGCSVEQDLIFPADLYAKKIHLYAHSSEESKKLIPDDIVLGKNENERIISRLRYNSNANLRIISQEGKFYIYDLIEDVKHPVRLVRKFKSQDRLVNGQPLSTICSYLGFDLLGVIPSNYCFYFKDGAQCRFCEILPTYKKMVDYDKALKDISTICEAFSIALDNDPELHHLAVTTGNFRSYDYTFEYFIQLGQKLSEHLNEDRVQDSLATLMPPDNFNLINNLGETLFNKIYFPLEVFEESHFKSVCPGKAKYGYQKMMQAFDVALRSFGKGNVYTNFVYGVQSLNSLLDPKSFSADRENELSLLAVEEMLARGIIPAFTLYHFGGFNQIGKIALSASHAFDFFKKWGELVYESKIVSPEKESVLFSRMTLSNTLFNDAYLIAKQRESYVSFK